MNSQSFFYLYLFVFNENAESCAYTIYCENLKLIRMIHCLYFKLFLNIRSMIHIFTSPEKQSSLYIIQVAFI